ncbi:hypothetical protein [Cecembia sp.]|uniref:hypothetical protein n=1 Tax=Cecembia sp. TaxID=1898110 RepID=UPI0025BAA8E5|nr:hypothetical protein [Cecembia sp.]
MKNFRLIGVLLFIIIMGSSCKTYKDLKRVAPRAADVPISEQVQKLKPGDAIKIYEKISGRATDLEYVTIENGILRGFQAGGSKSDLTSIRLEDIGKIEVKKFNAGKTGLAIGAVYAVAMLIGFTAYLLSIGD